MTCTGNDLAGRARYRLADSSCVLLGDFWLFLSHDNKRGRYGSLRHLNLSRRTIDVELLLDVDRLQILNHDCLVRSWNAQRPDRHRCQAFPRKQSEGQAVHRVDYLNQPSP